MVVSEGVSAVVAGREVVAAVVGAGGRSAGVKPCPGAASFHGGGCREVR